MLGPRLIDLGNPVNRDHPLNRGLVSWWLPLPNNSGGYTLFDIAGKYNGTLTNIPTWAGPADRPGGFNTLSFSGGSSQYIPCGQPIATGATTATICGWGRRSTTGTRVVFGNETFTTRFNILWDGGGNCYWQCGNGGSAYASIGVSGTDWHHFAAVYNGSLAGWSRVVPYIDGVQRTFDATSGTPDASLSADTFSIGRELFGSRYSTGKQDDTRVYSRTLASDEMLNLYNESRLGHPNTLRRFVSPLWVSPGVAEVASGKPTHYMHYARMRA